MRSLALMTYEAYPRPDPWIILAVMGFMVEVSPHSALRVPTKEVNIVNIDWQIQMGHLLQKSGMPYLVKITVADELERSMLVMVLSREIIAVHGELVGRNTNWSEKIELKEGMGALDRGSRELRFSP